MAENPNTWKKAEYIILKAIEDFDAAMEKGLVGLSLPARIAQYLRQEGLLNEFKESYPDPGPKVDPFELPKE